MLAAQKWTEVTTMRDIEFRGKRTDNGEWVYGYYAHLHKTTYCFKEDYDAHPENELHRMIFEHEQDWGLPNYHLQVDVDPETVGQYTGLKDKNGTKIFEGDIAKKFRLGKMCIYQIVYDNGLASFIGQAGMGFTTFDHDSEGLEVIGNIYDNPELLEGDGSAWDVSG